MRTCLDLTIINDILFEDVESLRTRLVRVEDSDGNLISRVTLEPDEAEIDITDNDRKWFLGRVYIILRS